MIKELLEAILLKILESPKLLSVLLGAMAMILYLRMNPVPTESSKLQSEKENSIKKL